jgi:Cd2+/Zn2+-exporting ATPase
MPLRELELPVQLPSGPDGDRYVGKLQGRLQRIKGVAEASVNNARTNIRIAYDPDIVSISHIELEAREAGADLDTRLEHHTIQLPDLDCPDCASSLERVVRSKRGVVWASCNFAAAQMHVEFERGKITMREILASIERQGKRAVPLSAPETEQRELLGENRDGPAAWWEANRRKVATGAALVLLACGLAFSVLGASLPAQISLLLSILVGGVATARAAVLSLRARSIDMNVLMSLAVVGALATGELAEGAAVVVLFSLGNLLQAGAMERTRKSIRRLLDTSPKTAHVKRGTGEFDTPVDQVRLWDIVVVKPGEGVPVDGVIISGSTSVNEASITGESMPAEKTVGDRVYAGTLNLNGTIEFEVTHVYRETTLARIIHRVEEAQSHRAPAQQYVDIFARRYTPMVLLLAVLTATVPPLAIYARDAAMGASTFSWIFTEWLSRGLSLLIIACPCALVISIPAAIVTAIGAASRNGVLIKGGAFLEEAGRIKAILYDKTGTLTQGRFSLEDVVPMGSHTAVEVFRTATALEAKSQHPLADAFLRAYAEQGRGELPLVTEFEALTGLGVRGNVRGRPHILGNAALIDSFGMMTDAVRHQLMRAEGLGHTAVVLADEQGPMGVLILADRARPGNREVVAELARLGVEHQAMLTGDNLQVARMVAEQSGIREYRGGLLPEHKLSLLKEYQRQYGTVAMVGDGVNDAPALAAANLGIVMGAAGSDTAVETADVALMGDDLAKIPYLIRLSRRTVAVIRQNVAFSLISKAALIIAAVFVGIPLWLAVAGDVGVSLLVTLNALRLRRA